MIGVSAHDGNYDGYSDVWVWWLEHGLDGIAGGLIAVAGVAVTLWYDRRSRREERAEQDHAEVEAAVRRIREKALDADMQLAAHPRLITPAARSALHALDREIKLELTSLQRAEALAGSIALLGGAAESLVRESKSGSKGARRITGSIVLRCSGWLGNPEGYSDEAYDRTEVMMYGQSVTDMYVASLRSTAQIMAKANEVRRAAAAEVAETAPDQSDS